ncbi:hypothetical protein K0U07_04475 [bacterium]|nr:hypothetical protein [bacterium]
MTPSVERMFKPVSSKPPFSVCDVILHHANGKVKKIGQIDRSMIVPITFHREYRWNDFYRSAINIEQDFEIFQLFHRTMFFPLVTDLFDEIWKMPPISLMDQKSFQCFRGNDHSLVELTLPSGKRVDVRISFQHQDLEYELEDGEVKVKSFTNHLFIPRKEDLPVLKEVELSSAPIHQAFLADKEVQMRLEAIKAVASLRLFVWYRGDREAMGKSFVVSCFRRLMEDARETHRFERAIKVAKAVRYIANGLVALLGIMGAVGVFLLARRAFPYTPVCVA